MNKNNYNTEELEARLVAHMSCQDFLTFVLLIQFQLEVLHIQRLSTDAYAKHHVVCGIAYKRLILAEFQPSVIPILHFKGKHMACHIII